jgi:hypothetical protein
MMNGSTLSGRVMRCHQLQQHRQQYWHTLSMKQGQVPTG